MTRQSQTVGRAEPHRVKVTIEEIWCSVNLLVLALVLLISSSPCNRALGLLHSHFKGQSEGSSRQSFVVICVRNISQRPVIRGHPWHKNWVVLLACFAHGILWTCLNDFHCPIKLVTSCYSFHFDYLLSLREFGAMSLPSVRLSTQVLCKSVSTGHENKIREHW